MCLRNSEGVPAFPEMVTEEHLLRAAEKLRFAAPVCSENLQFIYSDLDGSLLNSELEVPPLTRLVLFYLKECCGKKIGLCSGRTDLQMRRYAAQLETDLPLISCNGALLRDREAELPLRHFPLDRGESEILLARLRESRTDFLIYTPSAVYYPAYSESVRSFFLYNEKCRGEGRKEVPLKLFSDQESLPDQAVKIKLLCAESDPKAHGQIVSFTENLTKLERIVSSNTVQDIMRKGCGKAEALRFVARQEGLGEEHILYFGDHLNDLEAVSEVGCGVALGNARPEVREKAKLVTFSCDEEGIAYALLKIFSPNLRTFSEYVRSEAQRIFRL